MESGAPLGGHFANVHDGFRIVGVDVENGGIDDAGHVRAVGRRARMAGISGETNLVVCHDVDRAAGRVVRQIRQSERLVHDSLAGESGVAVQKDRHRLKGIRKEGGKTTKINPFSFSKKRISKESDLFAFAVALVELLGARFALHDRVDGLQMRRISHNG